MGALIVGSETSRSIVRYYTEDQMSLLAENGSQWSRADQPWARADLFFLADAVAHGIPFADVAGFLGRTEIEVRQKSKYYLRARGAMNGRAV